MTALEFKAALAVLGLSVRRAAPEFGVGLRTAYGYARGEYVIPRKVAELVQARLRLSRRRKPSSICAEASDCDSASTDKTPHN